jgi:hypothetical protein
MAGTLIARGTKKYIVTCIPIARQRVGKHILATNEHATIGRLLLSYSAVNRLRQQYRLCFRSVRAEWL